MNRTRFGNLRASLGGRKLIGQIAVRRFSRGWQEGRAFPADGIFNDGSKQFVLALRPLILRYCLSPGLD